MARTVLPFVGAAIGFWVGGPTGAQVGFALGGVIGNAVDPVKNIGPRIGETGAQTSAEGAPRGIVFGTVPVTGNVIASGPLIKGDFEEGGGKGGPVNVTERCFRTYVIRICEGPIKENGVLRVWEDDKLVYDMRQGSTMVDESIKWLGASLFYWGDEAQLPDVFATINIHADTPAYRGSAYFLGAFRDLTDRRGSIPQYRFEVSTTQSAISNSGWHESLTYTGDGTSMAYMVPTIDLSEGGLVWVTRTDVAEPPMMFYIAGVGETVFSMHNKSISSGEGPPDNPVSSPDSFFMPNLIGLSGAPNTFGGNYIAYTFKKSEGNFDIVKYIGEGTSAQAVTHSLGVAPAMHFVRQLDDPENTIGYLHLAHFNGLQRLFITSDSNVASVNLWGNTAPTPTQVTVGNSTAINGAGRNYIMFLFGGPDTYTSVHEAGTELSIGFNPVFAFLKRRTAESSNFRYNLAIGASGEGFSGDELMTYGDKDGGVSVTEERIVPVTDGVYEISTATESGGIGPWEDISVDVFMINGASVPSDTITLGDIVADIHARCGVPAGIFDVSELTDIVAGLVLAGDYTGADAVNTLRGPYFFDKAEANGKIYYPKRGAAVVDTLTIDDMIDEPDTQMREQAIEYPRKFHLFYQHAVSGYATVKATSQRSSPDVRVVGETTAQVPVVLNEDQAAQTAHKMHKVSWAEAEGEVKFSVPWSFIARVPSNPIGLFLRGRVSRLRISDMALADGVIGVTARHDRQSAYTSNVTGVPIPEPTPPPATIVGSTTLVVLDIPSLRDEDDDLNVYYAVTGAQPAWYGAVIQRSADGGATWTAVETITNAQVVGELTESLADADADITDTTNSVTVRLYRNGQTLESITDTQFLAEGGAFAIKDADGSIEILQARDWEEDSAGDWIGTMLHRGRLNTQTNAHAPGAMFVMLDRVRHSPMPSALIGQEVTYRAISLDEAPELATLQTETYNGTSQIEWPVASLMLERDSSDIITASWAPRYRFGTDDNPVASINFQGYRITIADGIAPAVVIEQTMNTLVYDASALATPVDVIVQSLNRITGAGSATSGTI